MQRLTSTFRANNMAKGFGSGLCVHCGHYAAQLTSDHVLPESWYPESTPPGIEKWQAPSCEECNHEYGKLERFVFQHLAFGVDPWIIGGEGIGERAFRSIDPGAGKNENDRAHRNAGLESMNRRLTRVSAIQL